jgi:proline iminopeptidase
MPGQFPPIEPYATGMLDAGGRHRLYWEACGNPKGRPALFLHGGPGSGCSSGQRRFFDPTLYNAVLFDQRSCGRSRPLASDCDCDLSANTTAHLIADIEALRELHRVDRWTILGLSWGSTLGLAYAETYPDRVSALVLALVTTTSHHEVQWITEDIGRVFPQQWERFIGAIPERLRHLRPVEAYAQMLADADPLARDVAAREWCAWEDAHISLTPGHAPNPRY